MYLTLIILNVVKLGMFPINCLENFIIFSLNVIFILNAFYKVQIR